MEQQYSPRRFSFLPPVIKNLLIINTLVYLSTFFFRGQFGIEINDYLGLHYPGSTDFRFFQFITYQFAHASFDHLFFNMFALWMFGYVIENVMGSKRFLIYYLVCGIGAALTHYALQYFTLHPTAAAIDAIVANPTLEGIVNFASTHQFSVSQYSGEIWTSFQNFQSAFRDLQLNPNDHAAMQTAVSFLSDYKEYYLNLPNIVGASGCVYGVLLAFGMLYPNSYVYLYFLVPIKTKWMIIAYILIELIDGVFGMGKANVAHFAHLGGMLAGFIMMKLWNYKKIV